MIVILFGLRGSGIDTAKAELQSLGVQVTTYTEASPLIQDRGASFFKQPVLFVHLNREEAQAKARLGFVQYASYSDFAEVVDLTRVHENARLVNIDNNTTVSNMTRDILRAVAELQEAVDGAEFALTEATEIEVAHGQNTWRPKVTVEVDGATRTNVSHLVVDANKVRCYFDAAVTGTLRIRA